MADSPVPRDGGRLSAPEGADRSVTGPDSPAAAEARRMAADYRRFGSRESADALDGVLAELDEARRRLRELETRVPSGFLDALDAVEQSEPLAEWRCPSCGATTRARMADRVLDERGFVDLDATYHTGSPASDRLVAECEQRRAAVAPSERPPAALAATETSEPGSSASGPARGAYGAPQRERSDPETAEAVCTAVGGTVGQSETGEGCEAVHGGAEGADG